MEANSVPPAIVHPWWLRHDPVRPFCLKAIDCIKQGVSPPAPGNRHPTLSGAAGTRINCDDMKMESQCEWPAVDCLRAKLQKAQRLKKQ
jgi:hypothetical protein